MLTFFLDFHPGCWFAYFLCSIAPHKIGEFVKFPKNEDWDFSWNSQKEKWLCGKSKREPQPKKLKADNSDEAKKSDLTHSLILRQTRVKKKWLNICIYKFIQRLSQFDLDEQREQLGKITWKFSCQNHFQLTTVTKMVAAWKAEEDRCESFFLSNLPLLKNKMMWVEVEERSYSFSTINLTKNTTFMNQSRFALILNVLFKYLLTVLRNKIHDLR